MSEVFSTGVMIDNVVFSDTRQKKIYKPQDLYHLDVLGCVSVHFTSHICVRTEVTLVVAPPARTQTPT